MELWRGKFCFLSSEIYLNILLALLWATMLLDWSTSFSNLWFHCRCCTSSLRNCYSELISNTSCSMAKTGSSYRLASAKKINQTTPLSCRFIHTALVSIDSQWSDYNFHTFVEFIIYTSELFLLSSWHNTHFITIYFIGLLVEL
jgi:hypothetical protein